MIKYPSQVPRDVRATHGQKGKSDRAGGRTCVFGSFEPDLNSIKNDTRVLLCTWWPGTSPSADIHYDGGVFSSCLVGDGGDVQYPAHTGFGWSSGLGGGVKEHGRFQSDVGSRVLGRLARLYLRKILVQMETSRVRQQHEL